MSTATRTGRLRAWLDSRLSTGAHTTDDRGRTVEIDPARFGEFAIVEDGAPIAPPSPDQFGPTTPEQLDSGRTAGFGKRLRYVIVVLLFLVGLAILVGTFLVITGRIALAAGLPWYLGPLVAVGPLMLWGTLHRESLQYVIVVLLALVGLAIVVGGCLMITGRIALAAGLPRYLGPLIAVGILMLWGIIRPVVWRDTQGEIRRSLHGRLERNRCGACGYPLVGRKPDTDGCTGCPECGAAWRLDVWKEDFPPYQEPRGARPLPKGDDQDPLAVQDARGSRVRLLCVCPVHEVSGELRRRRILLLRRWLPGDATRLFICTPFGAFAGLAWLAHVVAPPGDFVFVLGLFIFEAIIVIGAAAWHWRETRHAAIRETVEEITRSGRCACCTGALRERLALADGARVCPACGAAWPATRTACT